MRALLVFLFLFGCSGWAWTLVPWMTSGKDSRMELLRKDPEPIGLNVAIPGSWTLELWLNRDEPPTVIEGLASVKGCLAARRRIFGLDGRTPMAKCRFIDASGVAQDWPGWRDGPDAPQPLPRERAAP